MTEEPPSPTPSSPSKPGSFGVQFAQACRDIHSRSFLILQKRLVYVLMASFIFAALMLWQLNKPPSYRFTFAELSDSHDLVELESAARVLRSIKSWTPTDTTNQHLEALNSILQIADTNKYKRWRDLSRLTNGPAQPSLQILISHLDQNLPDSSFEEFVASHSKDRLKTLRNLVDLANSIRKENTLRQLLARSPNAPGLSALFARLEIDLPPDRPGFIRRTLNSMRGKQTDDHLRWTRAVLLAFDRDVSPLLDWRSALAILEQVHLNELGGASESNNGDDGFVLIRRSDGSPEILTTKGGRINFELVLRDTLEANDHGEEWNLGLHFSDFDVFNQDETAVLSSKLPPPDLLTDKMVKFLYQMGVPSGAIISNIEVLVDTNNRISIRYDLIYKGLLDARIRHGITIRPNSNLADVRSQAEDAWSKLEPVITRTLLDAKVLRGFPASIVKDPSNDHLLGILTLPGATAISIVVVPTESGLELLESHRNHENLASLNDLLAKQIVISLPPELRTLFEVARPFFFVTGLTDLAQVGFASGTASIKGTRMGLPEDLLGTWSIDSNGGINVTFPASKEDYLKKLRDAIASPPKNRVKPSSTPVNRKLISNHLSSAFPALKDHLSIFSLSYEQGRAWLTLNLSIVNLPPILIGPVPIDDSARIPEIIGAMLSADSVRLALAGKIKHPTFGDLAIKLTGWDPVQARLDLDSHPDWPDLGKYMTWAHTISLADDQWQEPLLQDVALLLEPHLNRLEEAIEQIIENLTLQGVQINLKVERDAFGSDKWLRSSPLGIQFRASMRIPSMPVELTAKGIEICQKGISFPREIRLNHRTTIKHQYIALSDPGIIIRITDKEVERLRGGDWEAILDATMMIEAKITPPIIPLGTGATSNEVKTAYQIPMTSSKRLRMDNPWLHLLYLHGSLGGSLRLRTLAAEMDTIALQRHGIAKAEITWDTGEGILEGNLKSGGSGNGSDSPWPWKLDGAIRAQRGEGFSLAGEALLRGISVRGKGLYTYTGDEAQGSARAIISFEGLSRVPIIGEVILRGETDACFNNFNLNGEGRKALFGRTMNYEVNVHHEHGITCRLWFIDPSGIVEIVYTTPHATEQTEPEFFKHIEETLKERPKIPTKEESEIIVQLPTRPRPPSIPQERALPRTNPATQSSNLSFFSENNAENLKVKFVEGDMLLSSTKIPNLMKVSQRSVHAKNDGSRIFYVSIDDDKTLHLLSFERATGRCWHSKISSIQQDSPLQDYGFRVPFTEVLESIEITDEFAHLSPHLSGRELMRISGVFDYFYSLSQASTDTKIRELTSGYFVEANLPNTGSAAWLSASNGSSLIRAKFSPTALSSGSLDNDFLEYLSTVLPSPYNWIYQLSQGTTAKSSQVSVLSFSGQSAARSYPDRIGRPKSYVDVPDISGLDPLILIRAHQKLDEREYHGETIWFGKDGACVVTADGILLIPKRTHEVAFLTRNTFDLFAHEERRFLPEKLQSADGRRNLGNIHLAMIAAGHIDTPEAFLGWAINPMALLYRIASKE